MSASGFLTNLAKKKINDALFAGATLTFPANWKLCLYTTLPAADGTGGVRLSGNGYADIAVAANTTNFPPGTAGSNANGATFNFGTPSGGNWLAIAGVTFEDASNGDIWVVSANNISGGNNYAPGDPVTVPFGNFTSLLS